MIEILQYADRAGRNCFEEWRATLDGVTRTRLHIFLERVMEGNLSALKGAGVFEFRLHFGPGYRVYCGKDGETLIVLLGGGTKKRQNLDIERAQILWQEYKIRKHEKE